MRIAIFSDTFPPEVNGVANFVRLSAKALSEKGHEVEVFTVSKFPEKKLNEKIGKGKFKINIIPSVSLVIYPDRRLSVPSGLTLLKLKKFNPDIIHTHTPFALGWEGVLGAKILKKPLVGTHHTFFDYYLKHAKVDFELARKFTWKYTIGYYSFCDLVTVPSGSLAKEISGHGLKKPIKVLPYFIDDNFFSPAKTASNREKQKISLIYVGRLSYEKSVSNIIKAFSLVLKKIPAVELIIVGDGPEKKKLERFAEKLKIIHKVAFTGFLRGKKLLKTLRAGDIFVNASKTETFCIAILEAMAVGLPVVAVEEKGPTEFVSHNENGYLVNADDIKEMAEKIMAIISNEKKRVLFGKNSRLLAENYSKEKNIKNLEKIYLTCQKIS